MENNIYSKGYIHEAEAEKASSAYLMSTVILIVGLPMPIINVIATVMFYWANRRKTYFVRFHCMQSMLSQLSVIPINVIAIYWAVHIFFGSGQMTNLYISYLITVLIFNLLEFVASLYAATRTRKKIDVRFWFFGQLTERICKQNIDVN
ncbi:MAG: DUF4870 domain-containing protein [Prevotellaceae bacterium]|jgi:uncharacterized membrane protein|nr:DUF4870 domain-containing protein [Prevotellaceae bacterium]